MALLGAPQGIGGRTVLAVKPPKVPAPPKPGGESIGGRPVSVSAPKPVKATNPLGQTGTSGGGASGAAGSGTGTAPDGSAVPPPSPYDATYYQQLNNATLAANNKIAGYQADIANSQTGLGNTLSLLAHNQALAVQKAQDAENAKGGFAQGALGQTIGNLNQSYLDTQSADTQKAAQQQAAWQTAIQGAQLGLSTEQLALGLASAARASNTTAKNAAAGIGAPAPASAAPGVTAAPTGSSSVAANAAAGKYGTPSSVGANLGKQLAASKTSRSSKKTTAVEGIGGRR